MTEYTPAEELALAECVLITPDQDIWAHTTDFISEHHPLPPTTVYLNELNLVTVPISIIADLTCINFMLIYGVL